MRAQRMNRISGKFVLVLSLIALLAVLSGYLQAPQPDEGSAAHIFQLSIVATVASLAVFLSTADWSRGIRGIRPLAVPAVALALAFAALYYLEHFWYLRPHTLN
jgi:uncharacterized membrane protein